MGSIPGATLGLVSTIEELLGTKSSDSGLENRKYSRRNQPHSPRNTLYSQKLALTWMEFSMHLVN
jgi:hypothetical protein